MHDEFHTTSGRHICFFFISVLVARQSEEGLIIQNLLTEVSQLIEV